jgi:putative glutamine amidotransferase
LKPLIGITTANVTASQTGWLFNRAYTGIPKAVAAAGGLPVLIPTSVDTETLRALYERVDGLLLPGGSDINPAVYGADPHPTTAPPDTDRDRAEIQAARWAVADDKPLLGICRGHQLLNVALGGTLIQDIPSQIATTLIHDVPPPAPRSMPAHEVQIMPQSRLAQLMGLGAVVNSLHHQAVAQPATGAAVTAFAPDGIIEALELPDKTFVVSVQWHPEDLYPDDAGARTLFEAFVAAARR